MLTDKGKEFSDRLGASGERRPTGQHPCDRLCARHSIAHRLIKPAHPQANGEVERFNGRISEVLATRRFRAEEHLQDTLARYVSLCNHHIPQRALNHASPIEALLRWQKAKSELFTSEVNNLP